jgi:hypothetical protein
MRMILTILCLGNSKLVLDNFVEVFKIGRLHDMINIYGSEGFTRIQLTGTGNSMYIFRHLF